MNPGILLRGLAVAGSVALCSAAGAQTLPAYATFGFNNWTFAPIVENGDVQGFFCVHAMDDIVGNNLGLVWYRREAGGGWTTWAWPYASRGEAARYLRGVYNDHELFGLCPEIDAAADAGNTVVAPLVLDGGLFINDPVRVIVEQSMAPVAVMEDLVDIGWYVAPDLSAIAVSNQVFCDITLQPVDADKQFLDETTHEAQLVLFGAAILQLDCIVEPCKGCRTEYGPMVPKAGAVWVFVSSSVFNGNYTLCNYDKAATQHWEKKGLDIGCAVCTGSGDKDCVISTSTVAGPGQPCQPPSP